MTNQPTILVVQVALAKIGDGLVCWSPKPSKCPSNDFFSFGFYQVIASCKEGPRKATPARPGFIVRDCIREDRSPSAAAPPQDMPRRGRQPFSVIVSSPCYCGWDLTRVNRHEDHAIPALNQQCHLLARFGDLFMQLVAV